jgi:hypothetical protein
MWYIQTTANEEFPVVDDRFAPDLFADNRWELNDTLLLAPRKSLAVSQVDVNLIDVDPDLL